MINVLKTNKQKTVLTWYILKNTFYCQETHIAQRRLHSGALFVGFKPVTSLDVCLLLQFVCLLSVKMEPASQQNKHNFFSNSDGTKTPKNQLINEHILLFYSLSLFLSFLSLFFLSLAPFCGFELFNPQETDFGGDFCFHGLTLFHLECQIEVFSCL